MSVSPAHDPSAMSLYQAFLDEVTAAIWAGDAERAAALMIYPHDMQTAAGKVQVTCAAELAAAGQAFRDSIRRMGATEYHRVCKTAAFDGASDRIVGTHVTHILAGGTYAIKPFANRMWMQKEEGIWKGAGIVSEAMDRDCTILNVPGRSTAETEARQ